MMENERNPGRSGRTAQIIANTIRNSIQHSSETAFRLETAVEMSRRLQVSAKTVLKALSILRDEGLVDYGRGKAIWVVPTKKSASFESNDSAEPRRKIGFIKNDHSSSSERLALALAHRIENGEMTEGEYLPKVTAVTKSYRVSAATVLAASSGLLEQGLAHRKGRAYVVGRPRAARIRVRNRQSVILIVQLEAHIWRELWNEPWTRPFIEAFMSQASVHGMQTQPVLATVQSKPENPFGIPSGITEIEHTIHQLGDRYMGTLLLGVNLPFEQKTGMDISRWVTRLSRFRRPVVWYDHANAAGPDSPYPAVHLLPRIRANKRAWAVFSRCHPDERIVLRHTLRLLQEYGHHCMAYPCALSHLQEAESWRLMRITILKELIRDECSDMVVVDERDVVPEAMPDGDETLEDIVSRFCRPSHPYADRILSHLHKIGPDIRLADASAEIRKFIHTARLLVPFLRRKDITAIIAPNDAAAFEFYRWLAAIEVKIPEEISLVSFDNRPDLTYPYQISSISFGMDYLGYQAFHRILGDSSVRGKAIPGFVSYNHQASIGPPVSKATSS